MESFVLRWKSGRSKSDGLLRLISSNKILSRFSFFKGDEKQNIVIPIVKREINTFITKEAQPDVFQPAMEIRNTLTRLKEQIQNVE